MESGWREILPCGVCTPGWTATRPFDVRGAAVGLGGVILRSSL